MFENMTYENILSSMLDSVTSDVDKREGSVIYDALAPSAFKLAETYWELNHYIDLVFGDTTLGEYLDRYVASFGLSRKPATKSIRSLLPDKVIPMGSRWGIENTTYQVISQSNSSPLIYLAECEQEGDIGNSYYGQLQSLDNLTGVTAMLQDIVLSGQERETDENLRIRFYNKVRMPATSGNAYHYRQWALEVEGVGEAKVFPLWNGPGTVKILILDSEHQVDETLEEVAYSHIEEVRPIGATVTVDSPNPLALDISANLVLDGSYTLEYIQSAFRKSLGDYIGDIVSGYYSQPTNVGTYNLSYAMVGSILLSTPGVSDYTGLSINQGTSNITITSDQVPTMGSLTLVVSGGEA